MHPHPFFPSWISSGRQTSFTQYFGADFFLVRLDLVVDFFRLLTCDVPSFSSNERDDCIYHQPASLLWIGKDRSDGMISLTTAFRPGLRISLPNSDTRVSLPLEITVSDNGCGINEDIRRHLFEPFVSTKTGGAGLGLALVAKIIGDHGGTIECEAKNFQTTFRVMMPMYLE